MKNKIWMISILICLSLILFSCGQENMHAHTYSDTYSSNEIGHWYQATCEHTTQRKDFDSHTYGDWIITKPATQEEVGSKKKVCSVCSYKYTEKIATFSLKYTLSADKTSYIVTGIGSVTSIVIPESVASIKKMPSNIVIN